MSITPTEPLTYRAAEFALKIYELLAMLFAVSDTTSHGLGGALTADEFFFLEVGVVLISLVAIFHSSEVRNLALKAHVITQFRHGVHLQIAVVGLLLDPVVLGKLLKFCSLVCLFNDKCF